MTPMPPSEVRRRGDRLRRRNTGLAVAGGVLAAAVAIGTPVVALSGGGGGNDIQPAPSPTTTPRAWLTAIPAGFPLADGFPAANGDDGSPTEVVKGSVAFDSHDLCGTETWTDDGTVDVAGIAYTGETEDSAGRTLALYEDERAARHAVDTARAAAAGCPEGDLGNGVTLRTRLVDLDLGAEASLVLASEVLDDSGTVSGLRVVEIAQTGNAVYLSSSDGAAGGDQVVTFESERLRDGSSVPLAAMCVFAADPCE